MTSIFNLKIHSFWINVYKWVSLFSYVLGWLYISTSNLSYRNPFHGFSWHFYLLLLHWSGLIIYLWLHCISLSFQNFSTCREGELTCTGEKCTRNCTDDQFMCTDGRCIMSEHVCDGNPHCTHSDDELNCPRKINFLTFY